MPTFPDLAEKLPAANMAREWRGDVAWMVIPAWFEPSERDARCAFAARRWCLLVADQALGWRKPGANLSLQARIDDPV